MKISPSTVVHHLGGKVISKQAALISQGKGGAAPAPETPAAVDHRDDDFSEGGEVILC